MLAYPLGASFERWVAYWHRSPAVGLSILAGGVIYLVWDMFFTNAGYWSFNTAHVLPIMIFYLPVEEILFFVTVPYSMFFVFEYLNRLIEDRSIRIPKALFLSAAVLTLGVGFYFMEQGYTFVVLFACAACFIGEALFQKSPLKSRNFLFMLLLSFLPFLLFNYLLTSIPVVQYSPAAIWGIRVLTIPLEDFIYSYTMLACYGFFYIHFREKFSILTKS